MEESIYTTVSAHVHKAMRSEIDNLSSELDISHSKVLKNAIMDYMARQDKIELSEATKKRLEQQNVYKEIYAEDFLIREENRKVSVSYKEATFLNFMDKQIAQVWYMNKDYYEDSELEDLLRSHLESFRVRAEWHELEDRFKDRLEDPISYGKDYLDRNRDANSFEVDLS